MKKLALLLIVLLGVAHFATVSRCEEGECGHLYNPAAELFIEVRRSVYCVKINELISVVVLACQLTGPLMSTHLNKCTLGSSLNARKK